MDSQERAQKWWKNGIPSEERAKLIFEEVDRIEMKNSERLQLILDCNALYGGPDSSLGIARILPRGRRISHNVIAPATDALVAEVTQGIPRPMAVSVGGDFRQRSKCRLLTKYWEAKFEATDTHFKARQAVRDGVVSGLGLLLPYRENPADPANDRVNVERIHPANYIVDDSNCVDVAPREHYVRRAVDRDWLIEKFPKFEREIEQARRPLLQNILYADPLSDKVEVIQGWHLASGPGKKDGIHFLAVNSTVLAAVPYSRTVWPGCTVTAIPAQTGFFGDSLVARAAPAQMELNKLLRRIQEAMHLMAVPRVFVQRQGRGLDSHFNNQIGIWVEYEGAPPMFLTPSSMPRDVYEHVRLLEEWVYKEMGISELSAVSKKPPGLDSGAALRTYNDVQSRRWINLERSYERMMVELAREIVYLEKEIAKDNPEHRVYVEGRKYVKEEKWSDFDLPEDRYQIRVYSSSALPNTPAGKLQALEELVKTQVIDQKTFLRLADIPDFESVREMEVAPEEALDELIDSYLDGKEYAPPEPLSISAESRAHVALRLAQAELQGADEEDLDKLRQWIEDSYVVEALWQKKIMEIQQQVIGVQPQELPQQPGAVVAPEQGVAPEMADMTATRTAGAVPAPYR